MLAAAQIDSGDADKLKSTCCHRIFRREYWVRMQSTAASRRTRIVPTAGQNRRVPANTNVSEIEMLALTVGSFTESKPLISVRMPSFNHWLCQEVGCCASSTRLRATESVPRITTTAT